VVSKEYDKEYDKENAVPRWASSPRLLSISHIIFLAVSSTLPLAGARKVQTLQEVYYENSGGAPRGRPPKPDRWGIGLNRGSPQAKV
jgi:hypothetical protein